MKIQVDNVSKSYQRGDRDIAVLRDLDCSIPSGSFSFIVGPSGSGKSTLLYLMGALDQASAGRILLDGKDLATYSESERDSLRQNEIGFIFQSFNLLKNLTALDNVLISQMRTGVSRQHRDQACELLKSVGLEHRMTHRPNELSGGEQQRVAIARALLKNPRLILADEPTGELDSNTGAEVFSYLRKLNEEYSATVVVVTHDHSYITADDVILEIHDGQIVSADTKNEA